VQHWLSGNRFLSVRPAEVCTSPWWCKEVHLSKNAWVVVQWMVSIRTPATRWQSMYACHTVWSGRKVRRWDVYRGLYILPHHCPVPTVSITTLYIQWQASDKLASCVARRMQNVHSTGGRVTRTERVRESTCLRFAAFSVHMVCRSLSPPPTPQVCCVILASILQSVGCLPC